MGNIWKSLKLNTFVLSSTLGVFTLSSITPLYAVQRKEINLNDIGFSMRIEKLVEKINHFRDKADSEKLLEAMFELKMEIEGYTGKKIDLDKSLDQVERDVKSKGGKVDKSVMKKVRKDLKKHEKRFNHKALYTSNCIEFNLPYNAQEEQLLFDNELIIEAKKQDKDKDKNKEEEVCIPLRVTIGVTITLCGIFLIFVPIPICKQYAPYLIETGMAFLVDEGITEWEDKDKNKKD